MGKNKEVEEGNGKKQRKSESIGENEERGRKQEIKEEEEKENL